MIVIRMTRVGRKKFPTFRIVVQQKTQDPWGKFIELLGNYNPRDKKLDVKVESIKKWLTNGAQASDSVYNLFIENKIITGDKRNIVKLSKKRKAKLESTRAKEEADKKAREEKAKAEAEAKIAAEAEAKAKAAEEAEAAKAAAVAAKEAEATAKAEAEASPAPEAVVEETPVVETPAAEEVSETKEETPS